MPMLARSLLPASHTHGLLSPLPSLHLAIPQLAQPGGRACWQSSAFDFFLFFYPILGAAFRVKVCTISLGHMQEGVTRQTPPPTYYYIICLWPLNRSTIHHTEMCGSATCHFTSRWRQGYHGPKGKHKSLRCTVRVPLSWSSGPHSPSSLVPVSTTVSPHRNPVEQPVNHPASTGKAQHTVCSNINKHRHIPPPTHTYYPLNLHLHIN